QTPSLFLHFFLMLPPPPGSTLFPYTTLFRSSAEIVITNTGRGIEPKILPRIFDPFFRGDSSHSHEVEGCGLGLSIARWIANAHRSEEHTSELQSPYDLVCRLLLEKKKKIKLK